MESGFVSLIGAGPGDPELLTLKALRRLHEADLVAYDRLVNPAILQECQERCELVYVGKHGKDCRTTWSQEAINDLLVKEAKKGRKIVRLKGGDPFIFGRGGEEALRLRSAGIAFEIVPGISSAIAAPAYAGIPVTHRRIAASFAVVTGHEDPLKGPSSINWASLATAVDTLVILMGVGRMESIVSELIVHGRPGSTPAAAVRYGTTDKQETITAPLAQLPGAVRQADLKAPVALIVGEVVRLRDELKWFVHDLEPVLTSEVAPSWLNLIE